MRQCRSRCSKIFLLRTTSIGFTFAFYIELAKRQSNDNPVYYAQDAHARMCSIQKQAKDIELADSFEDLTDEKEIELMKTLQEFNKVIIESAKNKTSS